MKTNLSNFPVFRRRGEIALESISLYATRMEVWKRDFEEELHERIKLIKERMNDSFLLPNEYVRYIGELYIIEEILENE